jgi:hypothetical protein
MKRHAVPIIAATQLLLPVLALVLPQGRIRSFPADSDFPKGAMAHQFTHYRIGYEAPDQFFAPLEKNDRRLRPTAWAEPPKMFRPPTTPKQNELPSNSN